MDIYEQMRTRYGSTSYPTSTAKPSLDNENITQWLFEVAFFKDFVYRNPDKKLGKEFCDALVICGDTIIIVQIKTKNSSKGAGHILTGCCPNPLQNRKFLESLFVLI